MAWNHSPTILPTRVGPGSRVHIVAPSGPIPADPFHAGVEILRKEFGFSISVDSEINAKTRYLAGDDHQRLSSLHKALEDPDIDAIWCARGGYGSIRLAENLQTGLLHARSIPFIGFSDITALHSVFGAAGVTTFHGPVVTQLSRLDRPSIEQGRRLLQGEDNATDLTSPSLRVLRAGAAQGPLWGGNLALLASLAGTPWEPDLTGRVVFLEDVGEACYRSDRMIQQLLHSSGLRQAKAILIGHFTDLPQGEEAWLEQLWVELAATFDGPVLSGFPIGHADTNWMIPLGVDVRVETDAPMIQLQAPWVRLT